MTIGKRLTICITGMLAVVFCLAAAAWYTSQSLGSELNFVTSTIGTRTVLAGKLCADVNGLREKQRGVLLFSLARDSKRAEASRAEFRAVYKEAKAAAVQIRPLLTTTAGKASIAAVDADMDQYSALFEEVQALAASGRTMAGMALYRDKATPVGARMEKASREYLEMQSAQLAIARSTGIDKITFARSLAGILAILGLGGVVLIGFVVRKLTTQLQEITRDLSEGALQISAASGQIASFSQTLAEGASEQAGSLEETSASAEEITAMTRQNASNTSQVAELMETVDRRVAEGNSTLADMLGSMKEINHSSNKIAKIIKVIDEIAFQTNILALNAAVEAARAGQAGAGFAVVADEVRNLAQRSAQAAKDTSALIEESISTSTGGSVQLQKVADVVASITEAATKVKLLVDEVNVGSQEQAKGIEEIARALTQMERATQGRAAAAEESASASQEMSTQARSLGQILEELRTMAGTAA